MSRWPLVRLDEICEINPRIPRGQRFTADLAVSFVPMSAIDEIGGKISQLETRLYAEVAKGYTSFRNGDVLFAKITPCMENGKVAVADGLENGIGFGSTEFHVLRPSNNVLAEYVFYFIRQPQFRRLAKANFTGTAGQQRVPVSFLSSTQISLPPLPKQRRIVDILNHANSIRRLRREALEKARAMIPALFGEMFGDPVTNPRGWPRKKLGDFSEARLGKMLDKKRQTGQYRKPYLRNINVQWGRLNLEEVLEMDFDMADREIFRLRSGDLLICEGGAVGRAAIWQNELEECYFQKALHRVRPDLDCAIPEYLLWCFWSLAQRGGLRDFTTHSTIAHLTGVKLKSLPIALPPLNLQEAFAERISDIHALIDQQERQLAKADELMNALMAKFFGNGTGLEAAA